MNSRELLENLLILYLEQNLMAQIVAAPMQQKNEDIDLIWSNRRALEEMIGHRKHRCVSFTPSGRIVQSMY